MMNLQFQMQTNRVPEAFVCPITGEVMVDPVMLSDGWSFERSAAEAWLQTSAISPLTGERLTSVGIIPNRNLKNAISWWRKERDSFPKVERQDSETVSVLEKNPTPEKSKNLFYPKPASLPPAFQGASFDFGQTSFIFPGPALIVRGRAAHRVSESTDWYRSIAFLNRPLTDSVEFVITETSNEWGGLVVGVTRLDCKKVFGEKLVQGSALNGINGQQSVCSETLMRLVDEDSWCLNGQAWFHSPEGDSLAGFGTSGLQVGDRITLAVDDSGKFSVRVNDILKCEVRDAKCFGSPLWPWVSVTGSCVGVEVTDV
jgi:hypothetical protein